LLRLKPCLPAVHTQQTKPNSGMARNIAVLILATVAASTAHAAMLHGGSSSFLTNEERMRPDVVANTLVKVEEDWRKEAAASTGAKEAPSSFAKSCSTVVTAVIQGSGGDRDVAREYMGKVCSQKVLAGWHALRCTALADKITEHAMLADNYANRQNLNPMKVCSPFWSVFLETERNREAEEAKERAEKDKIRAEEEAKAVAAAAEAKKKADAQAKLEAEVHAKEEAKRSQEEKEMKAKQEAADAKARAAEAAARLAEKKAEAEKMQKEAQKKVEEAQEAEKEHQARQEEHQKAEEAHQEALRSAGKASPAVAKVTLAPPAPTLSPAAPAASKAAKPAAKPEIASEVKTPKDATLVAKVNPVAAAKAEPKKVADKTTKK